MKKMDVFNMLFLFACILLIGVKYWLHKNEENNHPLNAEANYAESGGNASNKKKKRNFSIPMIL